MYINPHSRSGCRRYVYQPSWTASAVVTFPPPAGAIHKVWDYHHISAVASTDAADSGRVICKRLAASVGDPQPWCVDSIKALYRWNIREAPQATDFKSHVTLTFRPLAGRQHGEKNSESLQEHRFYLIPEEGTDSEASFTQMKRWLGHCMENHPRCKPRHISRDFMPTRVLGVGVQSGPPPTHIRIVRTREDDIKERYMTLSHCWGKKQFARLTDDNFDELTTRGIPWKGSSHGDDICRNKNFAEAIEVTRKLGVCYICIDSFCIIQDHPSKEDWEAEGKLMHKVYRSSYSWDSDVLPVKYVPEGPSRMFSRRSWRILPSNLWDKDILGSHLYTRAAGFSKRMLSLRLLQFGHGQTFWDCATIHVSACETLPAGQPGLSRRQSRHVAVTVPSLVKTTEGSASTFWESAVRAYTSCKLTRHRDKGDAMWGIAKLVRDMQGEEHAHGLWSTRLEEQLAWQVVSRPAASYPEAECPLFPTWSWTCLDVRIQVAPRAANVSRFYVATDRKGGPVAFRLEKVLRGSMAREGMSSLRDADKSHARAREKPANRSDTGLEGNGQNPDVPSKLLSDKTEIRGHVCKGTLRGVPEETRWVIGIEGVRTEAVIEAYPDTQPLGEESPCEFLVLAASRAFTHIRGQGYPNARDYGMDGIGNIRYSGIGIMVQRAGGDDLRRVGAVKFRQVDWDDWRQLRLACGEDEEALDC
ncbi:heterokaryon incompatibility protein [Colletotrichum falcatum]|nr:heterokaryon incompatibility protein [Colletotrichum falcatum]